jgi:hypothetical protein
MSSNVGVFDLVARVVQVLKAQGKLEEAAAMQQKCLALQIKILGEEHLSVATTYNNLAMVCVCYWVPIVLKL